MASTRPRSRDGFPASPASTRPSTSHSLYSRDVMDLRPLSCGVPPRPYSSHGLVMEGDRVEWSGRVAARTCRRPLTSVGRSTEGEGGRRFQRDRPSTALGIKGTTKNVVPITPSAVSQKQQRQLSGYYDDLGNSEICDTDKNQSHDCSFDSYAAHDRYVPLTICCNRASHGLQAPRDAIQAK
jgi:hypothetical protein